MKKSQYNIPLKTGVGWVNNRRNDSSYLDFAGFAGSNTEVSPSVDRVLSKACLRFSGESQADSFRFCLPYVFRNSGFNGFMFAVTAITVLIN